MPDSNAFAIGTTACWSGCLYAINPLIKHIPAINDQVFNQCNDEQDND